MSDEAATPASALPDTPYDAPSGHCRIASKPAGHVLQILAPPFAADQSAHLTELSDGSANALRAAGPGIWYVVGDAPLTPQDIARAEIRLGPQVQLIDQSHGRVRMELSGPGAVRLLATGTAVNLSFERFPIGSACETLFGHIGVHLTRTGADRFELLIARSFAMSLWAELTG
jgi:sarcosine oxidase, subunit gamma